MKARVETAWLAALLAVAACGGGEEKKSQAPAKSSTPVETARAAKGAGVESREQDGLTGAAEGPLRAIYVSDRVPAGPLDPLWSKAPARKVVLTPQLVTVPMGGGATKEAFVQAMHDGEALAIRVRWRDDDVDDVVGVASFRDAMAVAFPTRTGERLPSPFMGDADAPVSIWQWTADFDANARGHGGFAARYPHVDGVWYFPQDYMVTRQVRAWRGSEPVIELEARGFGSLERKSTQTVRGSGEHVDGVWSVVLRRQLTTGNPMDPVFRPGESTWFMLAVWDGGSKEVNGMKSITPAWLPFALDSTRAGGRER